MPHTSLEIDTAHGRCGTHVFHPEGNGPWPGVIMYMDAIGVRPALCEIAERIANAGHANVMRDTDALLARHWETLLALFGGTLAGANREP